MSPCSQCGASLPDNASFCPDCGAAVSAGGPDAVITGSAPADGDERPLADKPPVAPSVNLPGEELPIPENIAGVIAYITIIPAVGFLFLEPFKRNLFVRFHAFQHLFLWVAGFACGIAAAILGAILQLIPFMRVLMFPLAGLLSLAWFFLWVLLVVKAYQHEMFKLPYVGDLAEEWMYR
jgi:uncharacterized membrane protein